ncbi:MAG: hypothetical protein MK102_18615 [Fuerstiella sp.]|nr:hypothetical protein [Fuerstiella sp.]
MPVDLPLTVRVQDLLTEIQTLAQGNRTNVVRGRELSVFSVPIDDLIIISWTKWTRKANVLLHRREEILKIGEQSQ